MKISLEGFFGASLFLTLISLMIGFSQCQPEKPIIESRINKAYKGDHKLRKFKTITKEGSEWKGSFFLIAGDARGSSYKRTEVSFSWQSSNGDYIISSVPLEMIRLRFDSTITEPYVKFRWRPSPPLRLDNIVSNIVYVLVVCKEEDYELDLRINEL